MTEQVVSVSSVLARIKYTLEQQLNFGDVWISGEVSNLKKHRSGHYYFSLKDERGAMNCVMFASNVRHLRFDLEEGMKVLVRASASVYAQRGSLQLYVSAMKPDGLGALFLELEQRKKRLEAAGYFDPAHKKPKPEVIENVAIITAKEGAAIHDVVTTARKRWPMLNMRIYPALVQGERAPGTIIQQLLRADTQGYDAILVVRGGGSFEDLFCFNDEELVKTIYQCKTYIVSGVGHEVDTTLCDLVADHRSVTPTAAAQWVTPDQREVMDHIHQMQTSLSFAMNQRLSMAKKQLLSIQSNRYLSDPNTWIIDKRLRLDNYEQSLWQSIENVFHYDEKIMHKRQLMSQFMRAHIQKQTQRIQLDQKQLNQLSKAYVQKMHLELDHVRSKQQEAIETYLKMQQNHLVKNVSLLDAFSPLKVIERGYSITSDENNHLVHRIDQVRLGQQIKSRVMNGTITSTIIDIKEEDHGNKKA